MLIKAILLAAFCSFVSVATHLAISLFRRGRAEGEPAIHELSRQAKLLANIWAVLFIVYLVLYFIPISGIDILINRFVSIIPIVSFFYGIIVYFFLSFLYLTLYYFINRSVSATILEIIEHSPEKKLTADEIKTIYNIEKKYRTELKGMLEGGFIIKESDSYRNTLKGSLFARIAKLTKGYLKLGLGG